MKSELTHLRSDGSARMVDVTGKRPVPRQARAEARILMASETLRKVLDGTLPKGDVLAVARVAGIQATKQVPTLIPLCHQVALGGAEVDFEPIKEGIRIECWVRTTDRTGVEMEALTGVSVAALTLYDMCKAVDSGMMIEGIRVVEKTKGAAHD